MFRCRTGPGRRSWLTATTALAVGACLALSGCGGDSGSSSDGTTTITFWDNNGGPDRTPLWRHIIAEFEKQNPKIKVKYVGIPIASVQQKYDTAIAGGGLPDVGGVSTSYLAGVAGQKALEPLDERFAASGLSGKIATSFVDLVKGAGPDGKLYTIPTSGNIAILWYRPDWFEQAGIEDIDSWDTFFSAAEKLTDKDSNKYGFTIRGGPGSIPQMIEEIYALSGIPTFFDPAGKSTINDPKNAEALRRIVALYNRQTPNADVNNDFVKMVAQFDGGSAAMMHHNLGSYQDHAESLGEGKFAGSVLPKSPTTGVHTVVSNPVDGLGVFNTSKNKDAAWKFAEFAASGPMNSYWNEKVGQMPANTEAADDPWTSKNEPLQEALEVINDPETKIVQLPYHLPQFNAITKADSEPEYQKVLLGKTTPQAFLDQLAQKLNAAQAEWKERQGGG